MPPSSICGMTSIIAICTACPEFWDIVEMKMPMPSTTNRNRTVPSRNIQKLPRRGIPNTHMPRIVMMAMSTKASRKYGAMMMLNGRSGIIASYSNVPCSRSLTSPMLVIIVPISVMIRPISPGIMTNEVFRSGLKNIVITDVLASFARASLVCSDISLFFSNDG